MMGRCIPRHGAVGMQAGCAALPSPTACPVSLGAAGPSAKAALAASVGHQGIL